MFGHENDSTDSIMFVPYLLWNFVFFLFGLNENVSQNGLGRGVFTSRPKICDGVFLQK